MFQTGDVVLYKGEEYSVIHVYSGSGYCEIRGVSKREQHLAQPDELSLIKRQNKNT